MGLRCIMISHHSTVASSSSSKGTTLLTSPISRASCAVYCLFRNHISRAFFWPTMLARKEEPSPASKLPTLGPVWPKTAFSEAMVRSHTTWSTWPPPMAKPLTMATTGLGIDRIWRCTSRMLRRGTPSLPMYPPLPFTDWSPPLQKALSPAPVRMMVYISGSSRQITSASLISLTVSGRKALRFSGRLMVIFAMPFHSSKKMSSYSRIFFHSLFISF